MDSQQVALQAQSHRSFRVDDNVTCLRHVNLKDCLAIDLLQGGLGPERRDKPEDQHP